MIGPKMTPMPQTDIACACRWGGLICSNTDCDSGTSAAPQTPCIKRYTTICPRLVATPHKIEAKVKPATEMKNTHLMPKRPASQPVSADRLARRTLWHQVGVFHLGSRLHFGFNLVWRGDEPGANGGIPLDAGRLRGGARPAVAIGIAADQPAPSTRAGDVGLGHGGHTRPDHWAGTRRLADRPVRLALGLFYQRAGWRPRRSRDSDIHPRDSARPPRGVRLLRFRHPKPGDRRLADVPGPRRAQGLVRLDRDLDRSNHRRARFLLVRGPYRDRDQPLFPQPRAVEGRQLRRRHDPDVP